jgi:hypothetical protein
MWPGALVLAAIVCWVTFYAKGGIKLETMSTTEIVLTFAGGLTTAAAVLLTAERGRLYGIWAVALLLAFTLLGAISIAWSVQPDNSWTDAGRMLAYTAVFAAAVGLARLAPGRWPAILGGLALASVIVCSYALLTKVFPGLAPSDLYARLEAPFGYWNATGLAAAMGVICCTWLGARRGGNALLGALAYPAMGVLLLTLTLAYSRGALIALAIGLLLWFSLVPLRLRGAAVLVAGALGAGAVTAWDFSTHALSAEGVPLTERASAGHQLGVALVAMIVVLALAGIAVGFATARRAPRPPARRAAGAALLALIALALILFAGALTFSHRGLTGSISHALSALTNPNAKPPPNTAGRLTAVASVRARYWKEALEVFDAHPVLGAGAEGYATARLRYRTVPLQVRHAHGFIVQTLADLGLVGLLLSLALLASWMAAAGRATHPFNRRWTRWQAWRRLGSHDGPGWRALKERELIAYTPERIGLLSMLCLVVVFGAHSLVDWTWYVPGDACVALLCAGWLAGRGPLTQAAHDGLPARAPAAHFATVRRPGPDRSWRTWWEEAPRGVPVAVAGTVVIVALLAMFAQWQPQRSADAREEAQALLANNPAAASAAADRAISRDPLSAEALFVLASVQSVSGEEGLARATLERAVRLQPSNPQTWLALGRADLSSNPRAALAELGAAIYLDPESIAPESIAAGEPEAIRTHNEYIQALRAVSEIKSASAQPGRAAAGAPRAGRRRHAPRSAQTRNPPAAR